MFWRWRRQPYCMCVCVWENIAKLKDMAHDVAMGYVCFVYYIWQETMLSFFTRWRRENTRTLYTPLAARNRVNSFIVCFCDVEEALQWRRRRRRWRRPGMKSWRIQNNFRSFIFHLVFSRFFFVCRSLLFAPFARKAAFPRKHTPYARTRFAINCMTKH